METFGERLKAAVERHGPVCVGVDPHAELLRQWGLPDTPDGVRSFCDTVIEALGDRVAIVKPQSAFFERFGSAGIAVLESTIRQFREKGALVLLDVKRGDIGSTAAAYARAYLSPDSPLYSDAMTVSPYLGYATVAPMIEEARAHGGGVFVLAVTSNPEAPQIQQAQVSDGRRVAQVIIDEVAASNAGTVGPGSVGVVFGATAGATGLDLGRLNGPVLAPGLGAQGGRPEDLATTLKGVRGQVLPSSSRELLGNGPDTLRLQHAVNLAQIACIDVINRHLMSD
jgi:orotidine-5'-phosphate decarboxylase